MKIYVASSWRNEYQPVVVDNLRAAGHEVYDFKNPTGPGGSNEQMTRVNRAREELEKAGLA